MARRSWQEDELSPRSESGSFPPWLGVLIGVGCLGLAAAGAIAVVQLRSAPAADQPGPVAEVGTPPSAEPAAPPVDIQPGKERIVPVQLAASPHELAFGGAEDGHAAVLSFATGGYLIEVFRTATGEARGQVRAETSVSNGYAVSPDGTWFAAIGSTPFEGNPVVLWRVADGTKVGQFTPYPRSPEKLGRVPDLTWIAFLPGDRLLALNAKGGFDVWSVPGMKKLHGKAGPLVGGHALRVNGFTKAPINFALSPDGKTLALFDGGGYTLYDPTTGAETGRTEPFTKPGSSFNFWGTALRADGSRIACLRSEGGGSTLTVWDTRTGKKLSEVRGDGVGSAPGMSWWGPDHVLLWQGGIASADVVDVSKGQKVAKVNIEGKLGPNGPGDYLWGVTGDALVRSPARQIRPGTTFHLTPAGLRGH